MREALAAAGGNADAYRSCARKHGEIAAYLELHIEQGPVLDDKGHALAAVTAIDGAIRLIVTVRGFAGHAGTVPMGFRRDALAAAAEMIVAIERLAASQADLVATVGRVEARPGRAQRDPRHAWSSRSTCAARPTPCATARSGSCWLSLRDIAVRRRVEMETRDLPGDAGDRARCPHHRRPCARPSPPAAWSALELSSGAGHDAMMMAKLCPSGMIFLRCKDGISHNPAESITVEDADVGVRVLLETVRRVDKRLRGRS